jgi:hypothetical protein
LFFGAVVVLAQLLSLAAWRSKPAPTKRLLVGGGAIAACLVPLAIVAANKGSSQISWIARPGRPRSPAHRLGADVCGSADGPVTSAPIATALGYGSLIVCFGVVAWGLASLKHGQ